MAKKDIYLNKRGHKIFMPLISAASPGIASNILTAEGISAENIPYTVMGGELRRADYGRTISGSLRLKRLIGLRGEGEQQNILRTAIFANIAQYLGEGYSRQDPNTLKRSLGGGMAQFININWNTGEMSSSIGTDPSYIAQAQAAQRKAQQQYQTSSFVAQLGTSKFLESEANIAASKGQASKANTLFQQAQQAKRRESDIYRPAATAIQRYTDVSKPITVSSTGSALDAIQNLMGKGKSNADIINSIFGRSR